MKYLKKYEIFEAKKEKKYSGKNRIILLGPPTVGKSTISKELGKQLGLKVLCLDEINNNVLKDFSDKGRIKTVELALTDKYNDYILDFGGGHLYFEGVKDMIKDYKNIFVLIN
jgi:shikimate kinase